MSTTDLHDHSARPGRSASGSRSLRTRSPRRAALALGAGLVVVLTACGGGAGDAGGADGTERPASERTVTDEPSDDGTAEGTPDTAAMCVEGATDCDDTVEPGDQRGQDSGVGDESAGGAAGSCLAGDEDCTDESYDGQDVARALPLSGGPLTGQEAPVGTTSGATATTVTGVHRLDDDALEVGFSGDPCTVVEDVVVTETAEEVRLLVLTGHAPDTEACVASAVDYTTTVELDQPLGDRDVLDLGG